MTLTAPPVPMLSPLQPRPIRTPEQWRDLLSKQLDARWADVKIYDQYYRGDHRLLFATAKFKEEYGYLFKEFADNWTPIVVDAVEERCTVDGFRFGKASEGDDAAWEIWQRNLLDAESQIAHTESLIAGVSYVLVAPGEPVAEITIEHASQMIVAYEPGTRRRLAALKKWVDDGRAFATLYLPDLVFKWEGKATAVGQPTWKQRDVPAETWPMRNPFGEVPVVPLRNRPRLLTQGESELVGVIPIQDAVNKLLADMLIASEFSSYVQRWAIGLPLAENDPKTGKPPPPLRLGQDRLVTSESPDTKFGQFEATDLRNFVQGVELLVQHVASQTRTPPHYFYLSGQFPSGESIKSAETGLVAKANRKMRHWGESWEDVIRLAFKIQGDTEKAAAFDAETIWKDPESRTESEHIDAIVKKKAIGVPDEQLQEDAGYTPQQRARFRAMNARAALLAPQVPMVPGVPGVPAGAPPVMPPG